MKLIIASNNEHKVREIKEILGAFFPVIVSMREAGITLDVEEDGETFEQNAIKKAEQILSHAKGYDCALSDDSGLMVDALNGAPGVYSARYAGEGHDDNKNNKKLLEDMRDKSDRACRFVAAVALANRNAPTICVRGFVEGELLNAPRGEGGFGYDPLFYYPPLNKTFSEMSAEEKNEVSHRRRALEALRAMLEKNN